MAERRREAGGAERLLAWGAGLVAVGAALAVGGVHPPTQIVISAAVLALAAVVVGQRRRRGLRSLPFATPLALMTVLPALQLVPLPAPLVRAIAPAVYAVREEVSGASWMPLTFDIPATTLEVMKALATLGMFLVVASVARRSARAARALLPIAAGGAVVAVMFLVQRGTHAQSVLGIYRASDPLGMSVVGTFINGNHGASFLALASLVSAGLAIDFQGARRIALGACALLAAVATMATASRGGAVGLGVGGAVLLALVLRWRVGMKRALAATVVAVVLGATATLWVADSLRSRLTPSSIEELVDNPKVRGWRDGVRVARRSLWTGAGRGAFESAVAAERTRDEGVRLVYAENGLVQLAADFGVPAAFAIVVLFGAAAVRVGRCVPSLDPAALGAAAGVVAVAVHELADFALEMPGVALPAVVALGVVVARATGDGAPHGQPREDEMTIGRRRRWLVAVVGISLWPIALAGGAWASSRTLDADIRAIDAAESTHDSTTVAARIDEARRRHPAADHFELVAAREALRARQPATALKHLNRAMRLHPAGWQGHRLAARALVALGQRRQAALELRLQAETGLAPTFAESLKVVGDAVIDSVPQRPAPLIELARWLARAGKPTLADEAARRAVDAALLQNGDEITLALERLEIAKIGGDRAVIRAAADAALRGTPSPRVVTAAAQALQAAKLTGDAEAAVRRALERTPDHPGLLLAAARIAIERDDSARAIASLRALSQRPEHASIAERRDAEELLAQIYDKSGDVEAAVLARARARLLTRQLELEMPR
jgi:O-antigen ligase